MPLTYRVLQQIVREKRCEAAAAAFTAGTTTSELTTMLRNYSRDVCTTHTLAHLQPHYCKRLAPVRDEDTGKEIGKTVESSCGGRLVLSSLYFIHSILYIFSELSISVL